MVLEWTKNEENSFGSFRDPGTYFHGVWEIEFSQMLAEFRAVPLRKILQIFIWFPMIQRTTCEILVYFHYVFIENEHFY